MNYRILTICFGLALVLAAGRSSAQDARWWKGNLHTHSFWSDGDDFPDMIADWYKEQGYQFLAISDHNVLSQGERWMDLGTNAVRLQALEKYLRRFGTNWAELREVDGKRQVRLKPITEYAPLFQEAGRFLIIQSEEITDRYRNLPVHLNATNLRDLIPPQGGNSVREVMQRNVDAVIEQSRTTGQAILPHLNHPNFHWGVTAEDLAAVRGERFFEVYNGHPHVHNRGDEIHPSTDRMWDIALVLRLTSHEPEVLYGIATDDTHHYHKQGLGLSNAGRGWIMVRAHFLTPESLIRAMEKGDFYASSGVSLKRLQASPKRLELEIEAEDGVQYRTEFIGTKRGVDASGEPVKDAEGKELPITRRYGPQIGEVLATVEGTHAVYEAKGDELYVRARITSSKDKPNPSEAGEKEMAWVQPIFPVAAP